MKYIGKITQFLYSKGYGFINSHQLLAEGYKKDIYFHESDCKFSPNKSSYVIFELKKYTDKVKAVDVKSPTQEIDYLLENWSLYSDSDKNNCIAAFEQDWRENLNLRNKLIDVAQRNLDIEHEALQELCSSVIELSLLDHLLEFDFEKSIAKIINKVIDCNYANYDFTYSKEIPSKDELNNAVMLYQKKLRPSIVYTHTIEDGYYATRFKWFEGSEDHWVAGKEEYKFVSSETFALKGISVSLYYSESGSGNYDKDLYDVKLRVYSHIMNSCLLWEGINDSYRWKKRNLLNNLFNNFCDSCKQPILDSLSNYFITQFPKYGEIIFKWMEYVYGKSEINDIKGLREDLIRIPYAYVSTIKKRIIDINCYILSHIKDLIDSKCASLPESYSSDRIKEEKEGLCLSVDGKVLYAITNKNVQEIIVPHSVSYIEDGVFAGCRNLKKIYFLGPITHVGHGVFFETHNHSNGDYDLHENKGDAQLEIIGDLSSISFLGYNTSSANLTINGVTKSIKEWSYLYNREVLDNIGIISKEIHIKHDDI